jgi:hypothetical protein
MLDRATHWFYAQQQMSTGASIENLRHEFWANRFFNVWFTLSHNEPPYQVRGLWNNKPFELEYEPRKYAIVRIPKDSDYADWLRLAFSRSLGLEPHFQYQESSGKLVYEWRLVDREARWQSIQGVPAYKNLKRLYPEPEYY